MDKTLTDEILADALQSLKSHIPASLHTPLLDAHWRDVTFGYSGVRVLRLDDGRFVKLVAQPRNDLRREHDRLAWLVGKLPVPRPLFYAKNADYQLLVLSEIPGLASFDEHFSADPDQVVHTLAAGLRQIHAVDPTGCPFDLRAGAQISLAQRNVDQGRVDQSGFLTRWQDRSLHALIELLHATQPVEDDLVFAHGDYSLPNILLDPISGAITGFIDWGRAGIADRRLDLVIAARSVVYNLGEAWVRPFYEAYGAAPVEAPHRDFYLLADEFLVSV